MGGDAEVRRSELIAVVSLAADLGMGEPLETGLATCLVALALARRLDLDEGLRQRVYNLSLLQHVSCTATPKDREFSRSRLLCGGED